jgi:hypothetical protein
MVDRKSLRLSAVLLLVGLLIFVGITALHPGGEANNHPAVFAAYAASAQWIAIHLGQFAAMAVIITGMLVLVFAFNTRQSTPGLAGWLAAISAVVAFALYGVLQAVDGIALKRAVDAWVSAPAAEKAARFASAEAIRWLEEGVHSYHDFMLGLALILLGIMVIGAAGNLRPIGYLMGLSGVVYLVQGWVLSTEGFSATHTLTIIAAEVLILIWVIWLLVGAWRIKEPVGAPTG